MIAANQIHARRAQQQFQAFCRKWADAYGVACVKNRIGTLAPNCSQGNLKCRQIAVDICQYRDLHVPSMAIFPLTFLPCPNREAVARRAEWPATGHGRVK